MKWRRPLPRIFAAFSVKPGAFQGALSHRQHQQPTGKLFEERRRQTIALLTAKEIFDLVRDDLVLDEEELARQSDAAFPPVSEITHYLLGGGGKRMRPALLLLSASYAGRKDRSAIRLAAVVELLHSATLIHDDVID